MYACLVWLLFFNTFAPVLPRPSPRVLQNATQCVLKLQMTSKEPHWITDRIVDSPHTRPERVKSRYEDASQRGSSHVAKDPEAVRCSQSLLVGRRFCGKLDWAVPTQGLIYYHGGHYTYEPDLCVLRRLGRDEAQACMADVGPVLFAGDSVTRYQFMTFMHFLASGKYQHPFDGSQSLSDATEHYQTKLLNQYDQLWAHAGDQVEEHGSRGSGLRYTHNRSAHLERAHLSLRLQADTSRKAHLYYNYIGRGLDEITGAIKWAMGQRQDWRYLIVNVCAHYEKNRMGDISGDVIAAVQWAHETYAAAFAEAGTQLVWKSCTTPQDNVRERLDEEERKIAEYAAATGSLLVYDTRTVIQAATNQHLVTTWSPGEVHYLQFMYEQWNDLLLNILCPDREGAASPDCEGVLPPSGAEGD